MQTIQRTVFLILIFNFLLDCIFFSQTYAQESVSEPQIPIYIVCPYHEDSLKAVYESSSTSNGSSLTFVMKKCDSLQFQVQKSTAENTAHFTWLYALIALLGIMNVIQLFSTSRVRKELGLIKRFEHQQNLSASEPPSDIPLSQQVQDIAQNQVADSVPSLNKSRKNRAKKPHK